MERAVLLYSLTLDFTEDLTQSCLMYTLWKFKFIFQYGFQAKTQRIDEMETWPSDVS